MRLSNDPEDSTHPDARVDGLLASWVVSKYRTEHRLSSRMENHLTTCGQISVTYDAYDSEYGCDCPEPCAYWRLEATLSCAHGVTRDFHHGEFGLLEKQIAELTAWEDQVREQTSNPALFIGLLPEGDQLMAMVVIYHNTSDYPSLFVARQHDIGIGKIAVHPEPLAVGPSLEDVRSVVPRGMVVFEPAGNDDPCIVEVYL